MELNNMFGSNINNNSSGNSNKSSSNSNIDPGVYILNSQHRLKI